MEKCECDVYVDVNSMGLFSWHFVLLCCACSSHVAADFSPAVTEEAQNYPAHIVSELDESQKWFGKWKFELSSPDKSLRHPLIRQLIPIFSFPSSHHPSPSLLRFLTTGSLLSARCNWVGGDRFRETFLFLTWLVLSWAKCFSGLIRRRLSSTALGAVASRLFTLRVMKRWRHCLKDEDGMYIAVDLSWFVYILEFWGSKMQWIN